MKAEQEDQPASHFWGYNISQSWISRISQPDSTIRAVVRQAAAELSPITDAAQLEAEVLLAHVLDTSRAKLVAHPERSLTPRQSGHYEALVHDRASNVPLPYLVGHVEFYGLQFEVTPDVLIPRPETETLVDLALSLQPRSVVDVGTGSGCIAVSLAVHLPEAVIYAIDISPAALGIAARNVERHGVADRVQLMVGDVLSPRPGPMDLIVSNPPYIPTGEQASLPASIRNYEPMLALDGGPDGLAIIRRLLAEAPAVLRSPLDNGSPVRLRASSEAERRSVGAGRPGGALLIEIGADQGEAVMDLSHTFFPEATVRVHPDLAGRDRVLEVQT